MKHQLNASQNNIDTGYLRISAISTDNQIPIRDARIEISSTGIPDETLEVVETDQDGRTENIGLEAPPLEFSMEPTDNQPYSEYNLKITAPGYEDNIITGVQILSGENGLQNKRMTPLATSPQN